MNWNFHLGSCAGNNGSTAKSREAFRMACLALGMERLGHTVRITGVPDPFRESMRWKPFQHLAGSGLNGINVYPAESALRTTFKVDVGFKCSVGTKNDEALLDRCRLLVAHEYEPRLADRSNLLPVPFMVHDSVMDVFLADGFFEMFIANDLKELRQKYWRPNAGLLGMKACTHYHRRRFIDFAPPWTDLSLYTYQPTEGLEPPEHLRWISGFRGGLSLPGTTPKTNLPSLLALLGVAIVTPPFPQGIRDTPPITEANAIVGEYDGSPEKETFKDWGAVKAQLEDGERLKAVVDQATSDYINGWSPAGQSRLIAERFS